MIHVNPDVCVMLFPGNRIEHDRRFVAHEWKIHTLEKVRERLFDEEILMSGQKRRDGARLHDLKTTIATLVQRSPAFFTVDAKRKVHLIYPSFGPEAHREITAKNR